MKSFIRAITITIVLNLLLAGSTTAQTTPAPAPAPAPAPVQTTQDVAFQQLQQQMIKEANKTADDVRQRLIQLNIASTGQYDSGGVLVIPTAQMEPQDLVTMMEDMTVMCRIFDKKLAQSNLIPRQTFSSYTGLTLPTLSSWGSRSARAMYIQGYGALFLTKVDFLLSPPPEAPEEKETKEEDIDPVWEQMKRQMYEPEGVERRKTDRPEEKYDAEKVENLKTTLIKALKHAANIRSLKPDESVILTVTGRVSQSGPLVTKVYGSVNAKYVVAEPKAKTGSFSPTVLTIRAKKADIDAFAKGQYDFDQFHQKTQLLSYPYLGADLGSGPSRSSWSETRVNIIR